MQESRARICGGRPGSGVAGQKSSHSTQTIRALINHSLQGIEEGSQVVNRLEENLQQVTGLVANLSSLLNDISLATLNQGIASIR